MHFIGGSKTCFRVFQTSFSQLSCLDCFNRRPVLYKLLFTGILEIPVPPHLTSFFCPSLRRCQYLFLTLLFSTQMKEFHPHLNSFMLSLWKSAPGYTLLFARHTCIHSPHDPTKGRRFSNACLRYRCMMKTSMHFFPQRR